MNGDVDAAGLDGPDGTRDEEADLTGETGVLVLLDDFVLQRTLHGVEAAGLPHHQGQHVYVWQNHSKKPRERDFQGPKLHELRVVLLQTTVLASASCLLCGPSVTETKSHLCIALDRGVCEVNKIDTAVMDPNVSKRSARGLECSPFTAFKSKFS